WFSPCMAPLSESQTKSSCYRQRLLRSSEKTASSLKRRQPSLTRAKTPGANAQNGVRDHLSRVSNPPNSALNENCVGCNGKLCSPMATQRHRIDCRKCNRV